MLTVQHSGNGKPPEVQDSSFGQAAINGKAGGTGLGVKVIKEAVDLHGGRVSVQSQLEQGTTIHHPATAASAALCRANVSVFLTRGTVRWVQT